MPNGLVLGLNAYHGDVSAALVRDGRLIAAVEEERFRRIKHYAGFPHLALAECLRLAGARPADVDVFAVSRNPRAHLWRKALFLLRYRPSGTVGERARNMSKVGSLPATIAASVGLDERVVRPRTRFIEHHPSHLASAAFVSPFDAAAVCAIDGFGDFVSTSLAVGRDRFDRRSITSRGRAGRGVALVRRAGDLRDIRARRRGALSCGVHRRQVPRAVRRRHPDGRRARAPAGRRPMRVIKAAW